MIRKNHIEIFFFLVLFSVLSFKSYTQSCTPYDYYPGVAFWQYPDTDDGFVAGQEGVSYNESLYFRTPDKASDVNPSLPSIAINSVKIWQVNGLPSGLSYACNPTNCTYTPNSLGCINVYGTPEKAGDYPLEVIFKIYPLAGLSIDYPVSGYTVHIYPPNATNLDPTAGFIQDEDRIDSLFRYQAVNNLIVDDSKLDIYFGMDFDQTEVLFSMTNSLGQAIIRKNLIGYRNKENHIEVDVSDFPDGIYFITIYQRKRKISKKVVIHRN